MTSGGKKLTSGKADATGSFTYTFKVGKPFGKRTVKVTGAIPERTGTAHLHGAGPGTRPEQRRLTGPARPPNLAQIAPLTVYASDAYPSVLTIPVRTSP